MRFREVWRSFYFLPGWVSEPWTLEVLTFIFKRNESSTQSSICVFGDLRVKCQIWKLVIKVMRLGNLSVNKGSSYHSVTVILCHIIQLSVLMQLKFPNEIGIITKSVRYCDAEYICIASVTKVCRSLPCSYWYSPKHLRPEKTLDNICLRIFCEYSSVFVE